MESRPERQSSFAKLDQLRFDAEELLSSEMFEVKGGTSGCNTCMIMCSSCVSCTSTCAVCTYALGILT